MWSWFDMHSEALVVSRLGISGQLMTDIHLNLRVISSLSEIDAIPLAGIERSLDPN